jgi:hypothetical protein
MKRIGILLALLLTASFARADVRLFLWLESHDEKTGEKLSAFALAPPAVMKWVEAGAKGDIKTAKALEEKLPKDAWMYAIVLRGEATVYSKDMLDLFEPKPCGDSLRIQSGTVEVNRKADTVRIALKVEQDGKTIDFIGNGVYPIRKSPTSR